MVRLEVSSEIFDHVLEEFANFLINCSLNGCGSCRTIQWTGMGHGNKQANQISIALKIGVTRPLATISEHTLSRLFHGS